MEKRTYTRPQFNHFPTPRLHIQPPMRTHHVIYRYRLMHLARLAGGQLANYQVRS